MLQRRANLLADYIIAGTDTLGEIMCWTIIIPIVYGVACALSGDLSVEVWPLAGMFVLGFVFDVIAAMWND